MCKTKWIKMCLLVFLTVIIIIGYGGSCGTTGNESSGSSTPPPPQKPSVTTNPATDITLDSATLNGTVNHNGASIKIYFQWGTTIAYGKTTTSQYISNSNNVPVSANISGLAPETTYHFRLVATKSGSTFYGLDESFPTLTATILPEQVTLPNPINGTNNISINTQISWAPASGASSYAVYFGTSVTPSKVLTDATSTNYNPGILEFNKTYYWSIDSKNSVGTRQGIAWHFTTQPPQKPTVLTNPADNITYNSATLNGTVNPNGLAATAFFNYGTSTSYGITVTGTNPGNGTSPVSTTANVTGLTPGILYYFRVGAENVVGITYGLNQTFTTPSQAIASGGYHGFAIRANGTLWAWGANGNGQLGRGDTLSPQLTPVQIGSDTWRTIAAGTNHSLGIRTDNTLWAWGDNANGKLGLGDTNQRLLPTQVQPGTTWKMITAGEQYTLGIRTDDTLWAWGQNNVGQLGLGDSTQRLSPAQTQPGTTWKIVKAGMYHSLGIRSDDTLWAWGYNVSGELGLSDTNARNVPTQVQPGTTWRTIALGCGGNSGDNPPYSFGSYSLAIRSNDTLWAWGNDICGQLGLGGIGNFATPQQVQPGTFWKQISAGWWYSLGIRADDTLWSWGYNNWGQLGLGDNNSRNVPTQVQTGTTWKAISANMRQHSLGIRTDDTFWAWAYNQEGELGLGDTQTRTTPTQVPGWNW
jgi:alpha-tubulin suppressor-like RCC1 family protein